MSDIIGVDVGGANLKIVDGDSVVIHYCPMWQDSPLTEILRPYSHKKAAVVMSGELADGFKNKEEGIRFIVDSVKAGIPDSVFYGMDGCFHEDPTALLAAANWLASADFLQEDYPDAVFVDMGSTTTDIIPLNSFDSLKGLTDLDRLRKGYMVYTGTLRTTVPAVLRSAIVNGFETLVSSEYFAQSADVHLVLGNISEDDYSTPTADGTGTSYGECLQRLSRVVCSDLSEIGEKGALSIAQAFYDEQKYQIKRQVERVMEETGASSVVAAGIGSHIISEIFNCRDLSKEMGVYSDAMPAYAVREVAERKERC
ncbi:H4MPT-linked C1 transfer pathway protein [Methanoplanus sp. FWC-SCC4]|uniref:H4MPT-linked C1 transfer pathway protein n=1 Tax=Methanochimaera problematica TaxID=2609417 RepID=A0AA97I321_9EURY|nr:hydantoinase/oxoprolinase family protein [Methanoplanus sp. FWC-SCC4]WOF16213.1 H4MPT-linked C1 transfer pathway protein [Methanoplanus sp. FWC-SCC4]